MPTESSPFPPMPPSSATDPNGSDPFATSLGSIKCSICGSGTFELGSGSNPRMRDNHGVVLLVHPPERICGRCVRSQDRLGPSSRVDDADADDINLTDLVIQEARESEPSDDDLDDDQGGLEGRRHQDGFDESLDTIDTGLPSENAFRPMNSSTTSRSRPVPLDIGATASPSRGRNGLPTRQHSRSLPAQQIRQWKTTSSPVPPIKESDTPIDPFSSDEEDDVPPPNPLLDVSKARVSKAGRGALFAGSIFRGTQTSGRSAYEVEVKFLDVNFEESTLSGYLSISHLTDAHPHLTTFFTGEIIGPTYGFLTGTRYGATEHDDMRHWGRFEQFRRPSTRADIVRPEMVFRDPLPDWSRGETVAKERDFVFIRMKEKFLVPDHTVRDISGASFAGFYFAMVDLAPTASADEPPLSPSSPTAFKTNLPLSPTATTSGPVGGGISTSTSPTITRRMSSSSDRAHLHMPRRRSSSQRVKEEVLPIRSEATIRGYYFHSLNQEPFQELFLTHVPSKSDSAFEMR